MATVTSGTTASIYCPLAGDIAVTPGQRARVRVENPRGNDSFSQADITAARTFSVAAGETLFIEAVGADVSYSTPAQFGGTVTGYTAAQLTALAAAGGLTPYAGYVASDTGAMGVATDASTLAEIDYDALALAMSNGLTTYSATEIEHLAGVPAAVPAALAAAALTAYPRRMTVAWSRGTTGKVVSAAVTFIAPWATPTNPSGNLMRVIQSTPSAHGMGATSDGKYLWIKTSAGVPTGFYPISTRASPNQIDVDVGASYQSLIASTVIVDVSRVTVYFPAAVFQIPAGVMGANGQLSIGPNLWEVSSSVNAKYLGVFAGCDSAGASGSQLGGDVSVTSAGQYGQNTVPAVLANMNAENSQRSVGPGGTQFTVEPATAIDTTAAFYCAIRVKTSVVDEYAELVAWRAEVAPLP